MSKGLKIPNKLWLKILIMISLILFVLLLISCSQNDNNYLYKDKNKIYKYYGYMLVTKHKNIHRWCEYSVYEIKDQLKTTKKVRLFKDDRNGVIVVTGSIPWIELSDFTPQRLSMKSNIYRAYQICRDFFVDPKPGTYKDLFNFLSTDYFDHIEMSFGEGFTLKGYARQYTKDDFVEVLSASDTLVRYHTNCDGGNVLFFNQRKRLGIKLVFTTLDRKFCPGKK